MKRTVLFMSTKWLLLIPMLILSTVLPLAKLALATFPPATLAAARFLIGGSCLLAYSLCAYPSRSVVQSLTVNWRSYLLLGLTGIFLNNLLQNLGLNLSQANSTSLLGTSGPIFATILAVIFLGERLDRTRLVGLGLSLFGVYLVTTNGASLEWSAAAGNLLAVGAAVSYSVYTVLSKQVLEHEQPLLVVTWSTLIGAALLGLAAIVLDGVPIWPDMLSWQWLNIIYLSTIPTSLAVVLYNHLLKLVDASQASTAFFLLPVFSTAWAFVLLGEQLSAPMVTGGAAILCGVWLTTRKTDKQVREQGVTAAE